MTTDELIALWASAVADERTIASHLSLRQHKLYSYKLKIAERFDYGRLALILPHGTSTPTTNGHMQAAAHAASISMHVATVFRVPALDPKAPENITYFLDEIEAHRKELLNKRCRYTTRVRACEHYTEAVQELNAYLQAVEYAEEVKIPDTPVLDIIEAAGDLKFLGKLGLEGDSCRIHALDEQ